MTTEREKIEARAGRVYATSKRVTTDAMSGAAGMLRREWGDYGYTLGIQIMDGRGGAVFGCAHFDGSEFFLYADRYGNAREVEPDERGVFSLVSVPA
jgi:hypothetical protein